MPEPNSEKDYASPELRIKAFWEKVPKKAYPAELLQFIGYFNIGKEALVEKEGKVVIEKIDNNFKGEIIIAPPANKEEESKLKAFDEYLREYQFALRKIQESENPEKYEIWHTMILDIEVRFYAEIAAFFDILRIRALKMALNEFNSSYTTERVLLMEKIRESSND